MKHLYISLFLLSGVLLFSQENPTRYKITSMDILNKGVINYNPVISANGLNIYFVSNMKGSLMQGNESTHDVWYSYKDTNDKFVEPLNLDPEGKNGINTRGHEGAISLDESETLMFITLCSRKVGYGSCDLYIFNKLEGEWGTPQLLPLPINSRGYETQPSFSSSDNSIYFVSPRKGPNSNGEYTFINYDIWNVKYLDNGDWGEVTNVEGINTKFSDCSPFITHDGKFLYFSSNRKNDNYGGYDLYISSYNETDSTWSEPKNLGPDINTKYNEQFISLPDDFTNGIYFCRSTKKNKIDFDIYYAEPISD